MNHTLDQLGPSLAQLREIAERHGRTTPIEITLHGDVKDSGDVERYASAGVTRLIVRPWSRSNEAIDGLQRFADEILRPIEERP
jgi:hypothetical protein